MKKLIMTLNILLLYIFLSSCEDNPVEPAPKPSFEVEGSMICNAQITFKNTSGSWDYYEWNFGDGTSSDEKNPPPKSYSKPGMYSVTLTTYNASDPSKKRMASKMLDLQPTRVDIKKIVVLMWDVGRNWDIGGGKPDVYVKIQSGGNTIYTTSTRDNCNPPQSWDLKNVTALKNLAMNNDIVFKVYDEDWGSPDDHMGTTTAFKLVDLKNYYPLEYIVSGTDQVSVQVHLNWH